MQRIFGCVLLLACGAAAAQTPTGRSTLTLIDPTRGNREIPLELYYPATSAGTDVPFAAGAFPVIAFGHGFAMQPTDYGTLADGLAAAGYLVASVGSETGFAPSHADFGLDLLFTAATLPQLATEPGNLLSGHVLPRRAIAGHSMGGGATWLAAAAAAPAGVALDCIAGLAPAETNPSAIAAASAVGIPSLILSGDADAVTPPADHHIPIHDATAADCRAFVSILDGGHCGYADGGSLCDLGELFFSGLDRPTQTALTLDLLTVWFDHHLKDDPDAWPLLTAYDASSPHTVTTVDCAASVAPLSASALPAAFPNPFTDVLHLAPCPQPSAADRAVLFALGGQRVADIAGSTTAVTLSIDPALPAGPYVLQRTCGTASWREIVLRAE